MLEYYKGLYVNQLNNKQQQDIIRALKMEGVSKNDILRAMNSKVHDLADTIKIDKILNIK